MLTIVIVIVMAEKGGRSKADMLAKCVVCCVDR
jgi:hypothetical protein